MSEHDLGGRSENRAPSNSHVRPVDQAVIEASGLFDREWYAVTYAASLGDAEPLSHFCGPGWRQGFKPNPYFDPAWYAETYADELQPDENPLGHYIRSGERDNLWPSPHFDTEWYRDMHALDAAAHPLSHYLHNRDGGKSSPLPVFDAIAYTAQHPDWSLTAYDPFWHSLQHAVDMPERPPVSASPWGTILGILGQDPDDPSMPEEVSGDAMTQVLRLVIPLIPFDATWYEMTYPDVAAAVKCRLIESAHGHYIDYGFFEGRSPGPPGAWLTT